MHPRHWHKVAEIEPPSGIPLLVCYDPAHLAPAILIAHLHLGHGWAAQGERVPKPLYWMRMPDLPIGLRTESSLACATPPVARAFF